jgi:hypothetical protein
VPSQFSIGLGRFDIASTTVPSKGVLSDATCPPFSVT